MNDIRQLHDAATVLREAVIAWLGDLVPPYTDEVLLDLQHITAQTQPDRAKVRALVAEAESVMEMLPSIPAQWADVHAAALAADLA